MAVPVAALAVGAAVVAIGAYALMSSSGAKAPAKVPTTTTKDGKEIPTVDLKTTTGYTDGFDAGHTDGLADGTAGAAQNKRPNGSYSADATQQAAYMLGYDPGYDAGYAEGAGIKSFATDSTGAVDSTKTDVAKEKAKVGTPANNTQGKSDGESDGYYAGQKDFEDGKGDPSGSTSNRYHNLRNAVAGLPRSDAYKAGYVEGLDDGYSRGYNAARAARKPVGGLGGLLSGDSGTSDSSPGIDTYGEAPAGYGGADVGAIERMIDRGRGLTGVGFLDRRIGVGQTHAGMRYSRPSLMADTRSRGGSARAGCSSAYRGRTTEEEDATRGAA